MNKGVVSVLVAYLIWGLYPFYFHAMQHVAPTEIVIHRVFGPLRFWLFTYSAQGAGGGSRKLLLTGEPLPCF